MTTSTKVEIAIRFRLLLVALIVILGGCNDPSDASAAMNAVTRFESAKSLVSYPTV